MYQESLAQKRLLLAEYKKKLLMVNQKKGKIEADLSNLNKRKHTFKLIKAGKVLERAGILDNYDEDKLYQILVDNRTYLLEKGS